MRYFVKISEAVVLAALIGIALTQGSQKAPAAPKPAEKASRRVEAEHVAYMTPKGWRHEHDKDTDTDYFFAPNLPKGQVCMLLVLPDKAVKGTFRSWFKSEVGSALNGEKVVNMGEPKEKITKNGLESFYQVVETRQKSGVHLVGLFMGIHHDERGQMLGFFATSEKLLERSQSGLLDFCSTLDFK